MPRLATIEPAAATGGAARILATAPINIYRGLAVHPPVFEAFVAFMQSFGRGEGLDKVEKEQVMLLASERGACDYCLAAHTKIARGAELDEQAALEARRGRSADPRHQALLDFATAVLEKGGDVEDDELEAFRAAGYTDQAAIEVVAAITAMTFTNLYNHIHRTEIDFPKVPALV